MDCPYLESNVNMVCRASVTNLTPTAEERVSYCTTEEHYRCPMLLAHILRGSGQVVFGGSLN